MRKVIEDAGNTIHESTVLGSPMQTLFAEGFRTSMAERLRANGGHAPHLEDVVRPTFAPGCRRLTPGPGFLEALGKENVRVVVGQDIASIQNEGNGKGKVILASGEAIGGLDVLVCATGFKVSSGPAYSVVGRNGVTLSQRWGTKPESYLSVFVDGFPNYAMMLGPNSAIGFGSLTVILESEADYACKVVRKLQKERYACADVRAERVRDFQRFVTAYFKGTVYVDKCRSWYKGDGGKGPDIIALWPGSTLHALEVLRSPRWEDFTWDSLSDSEDDGEPNALAWLVNGWSICETEGDPSWYLNEDEVDVPLEGRPEDKKRYKARPWSY